MESEPRLAPLALAEMDPAARDALLRFEKLDNGSGTLREPRNVLRTVANSPETLAAWMPFMDHARYRLLSLREREIIILRLSRNVISDHGWGAHSDVSRRRKVLEEVEISALLDDSVDGDFTPRERTLVAATDDLTALRNIGNAQWHALRTCGMSDSELVDLVMLVGEYTLVALVTRTFRTPLDDGVQPLPVAGNASLGR